MTKEGSKAREHRDLGHVERRKEHEDEPDHSGQDPQPERK